MTEKMDGASRRAQIIEVAAGLFNELGYHHTTMESLAQHVGIRKASLYYYFANKELILIEIHEEMINYLLERARGRTGPAAERVHFIMHDLISLMELYPGRLRVFFEHFRELPPEQRQAIKRKRDEYHDILVAALRDGNASGEFQIDDPEITALGILGMCNWTYQWFRPDGPTDAAGIARQLFTTLLRGIGGPHAPSGADALPADRESAAR